MKTLATETFTGNFLFCNTIAFGYCGGTHLRERNVVLRHFSLPVLLQLFAEFLVERTGVRQEPGGEEDVANEPIDLCLEALARRSPSDLLARQTVNQRCCHVHLASTSVRIVD